MHKVVEFNQSKCCLIHYFLTYFGIIMDEYKVMSDFCWKAGIRHLADQAIKVITMKPTNTVFLLSTCTQLMMTNTMLR